MARFLQYVFNGMSAGAIYSLLALGLVIVYRGSTPRASVSTSASKLAAPRWSDSPFV